MSRYELTARDDGVRVVVGWDAPLETYFVQAYRPAPDDESEDEMLLWAGTHPNEVSSLTGLMNLVDPWAEFTPGMLSRLSHDRYKSAALSPLQRLARRVIGPSYDP